jgi:hypothetical protein
MGNTAFAELLGATHAIGLCCLHCTRSKSEGSSGGQMEAGDSMRDARRACSLESTEATRADGFEEGTKCESTIA